MEGCLDSVMGRKFKASKFKILAKLAISRAAVLKKQRHVRFLNAKSDTLQLLNLGQHDKALLRVEHMVKEQNMMDVFVMIEEYCYLLIDRLVMLKNERECHDEVKEAMSSLIFASSRCGEFPELQGFRRIFASKYGKEFVTRAVELRNNCGVNAKIIQKLSTQRPSLESKMKVLKDIASENGIILDLVEHAPLPAQKQECYKLALMEDDDDKEVWAEKLNGDDKVKGKRKYRNVEDAALEAFESAAYAAAAARAAVQLSTSLSLDTRDREDRS
ncbi:uncharacterized protein [Euphorbia lathyris]|uniref:uncharacterized protein isoform X2 n=1 Tax=Euphorbia lathyris TaxID=212925 RepID=UPI003313496D